MVASLNNGSNPFSQEKPRVIPGKWIAQHQVTKRIERIEVYPSGQIEVWTESGCKAAAVFHRVQFSILSEVEFSEYLDTVHWVATQSVGYDEYYISALIGGPGGGAGFSSQASKEESLSYILKHTLGELRKQNPNATVTDLLCSLMPSQNGYPPIKFCGRDEYHTIQWVKELLAAGADANAKKGDKPLLWIVCNGPLKKEYRDRDIDEFTAITIARLLIEHGASKEFHYFFGESAMYKAISFNKHNLFTFLLRHKVGINGSSVQGTSTPLEEAIICGNATFARYLIEGMLDLSDHRKIEGGVDIRKGAPLVKAACAGMVEIARILLAKGVDVNIRSGAQTYAIVESARVADDHHFQILELLISAKADIKKTAQSGESVFTLAILKYWAKAMQLLLKNGYTPAEGLHYAFEANMDSFKFLVQDGASVDYVDNKEPQTCLQKLCRINSWDEKNRSRLKALLDLKADTSKIEGVLFRQLPEDIQQLFPGLFEKDEINLRVAQDIVQKVLLKLPQPIYNQLDTAKLTDILKQRISKLLLLPSVIGKLTQDTEENIVKRKNLIDQLANTLEKLLSQKSYFNPEASPPFLDCVNIGNSLFWSIQKEQQIQIDNERKLRELKVQQELEKKQAEIEAQQRAEAEKHRKAEEQRLKIENERRAEELKRQQEFARIQAELEAQRKAEIERLEVQRRAEAERLEAQRKATASGITQKIIIGLSGDIYSQLNKSSLVDKLNQHIIKLILTIALDNLLSDISENILNRKHFAEQLSKTLENFLNKKTYFDCETNPPHLDWSSVENGMRETIQEWQTAIDLEEMRKQELASIKKNQQQLEAELKREIQQKAKQLADLEAAVSQKEREHQEQLEQLRSKQTEANEQQRAELQKELVWQERQYENTFKKMQADIQSARGAAAVAESKAIAASRGWYVG